MAQAMDDFLDGTVYLLPQLAPLLKAFVDDGTAGRLAHCWKHRYPRSRGRLGPMQRGKDLVEGEPAVTRALRKPTGPTPPGATPHFAVVKRGPRSGTTVLPTRPKPQAKEPPSPYIDFSVPGKHLGSVAIATRRPRGQRSSEPAPTSPMARRHTNSGREVIAEQLDGDSRPHMVADVGIERERFSDPVVQMGALRVFG